VNKNIQSTTHKRTEEKLVELVVSVQVPCTLIFNERFSSSLGESRCWASADSFSFSGSE